MPPQEMPPALHCMVVDDQPASSEVLCRYIERTKGMQLGLSSFNGLTAFDYLQGHHEINLLFLDVEMPSINGFDLLHMIQQNNSGLLPLVILSTGHVHYAAQGYHFDRVVGFLQKVVSYTDFLAMVQKTRRLLSQSNILKTIHQPLVENDTVFIKTSYNRKERYERIDLNDLLFIKSDRNYVHLVTSDKAYLVKNTLSDMEWQLSGRNFIRIHKSYLINLQRIHRIEAKQVQMDNGKTVPISETYRSEFIQRVKESTIEDK